MNAALKAQHDLLLSLKPDGLEHEAANCPICEETTTHDNDHPEGGSMSDKTFTEAELKAAVEEAVAAATSPLQAKVSELENSQQKSEQDKAIEAVTAEKDQVIADLQAKLDAAVIEATAAREAKETLDKFWSDAIAETEEKAAREARREERLAKLAEVAKFPEAFLQENADRFVAMSDEEFAARLEEYRAQREALGVTTDDSTPPSSTALQAARETTTTKPSSALREVLNLRRQGVDPRSVRS